MRRIKFFYLALTIGLCLQAPLLFGQDQNPDKKDAKGPKASLHAGKVTSKAKPQVARHEQKAGGASKAARGTANVAQQVQKRPQKSVTSRGGKSHGNVGAGNIAGAQRSTNTGTGNIGMTSRSTNTSTRNIATTSQRVQRSSQRQSQQSQSSTFTVQGSRSDHYNGQWVAGNTHRDWDRNGYHQWNNNDYRWYDGGWLIINAGYYQTGSIVREVKTSLAQDGYYNGHINDHIGPRTRLAISNYESDNGLPGNGRINEPLLASLRID